MPFAIELFMDTASEVAVRSIWQELARTGICSFMLEHGVRPHITLAVWNELDPDRFAPELQAFAQAIPPLPFTLASIGVFPAAAGVVYLAPTTTQPLLDLHHDFHQRFGDFGQSLWSHYRPGLWVAHCTCTPALPAERIGPAITVCLGGALPIQGTIQEIGVVAFRPVNPLVVFPLGGPG